MASERGESSSMAALRSPRLDSSIPDVVKNDPLSSIFARQETSSTASFKPETEADRTIPASSGTEPRKGKAKAANIDNKPAQVPSAAQGQPSAAASDSSSTDIPAVTYKLRLTIYQKSTDKTNKLDINFHHTKPKVKKGKETDIREVQRPR